MEYEVYLPSDQLKDQVYSYVFLKGINASESKRVLPGGYCFLAFHLGDGEYQVNGLNGCSGNRSKMSIVGQATCSYTVTSMGTANVFLVLFKPTGLSRFFKICMPKITNADLPLAEIVGNSATCLYAQLNINKESKSRVILVERFLESLKVNHSKTCQIAELALDYMQKMHGILSMKELTNHLSINERTLQRAFHSAVGLPPKQYSRILRLNYLLKLLASGNVSNWSELLHTGGYYDQMHFIKDYKAFTGITPSHTPGMDVVHFNSESQNHFFSMANDIVVTDWMG